MREREFCALETSLACFRISLPKELRGVIGSTEHTAVAQLQTLIHMSEILLHHAAMVDPSSSNPQSQQSYNYMSPDVSFSQQWNMQNNPTWPTSSGTGPSTHMGEDSHHFNLCLAAAQGILSTIRETLDLEDTGPYNPFVAPAYYVCCRILCIQWFETQDPQIKADIDLIILVIDRIGELWGGVARKYKDLILYDLERDPTLSASTKFLNGLGYLGPECAPAYVGADPELPF